MFKVIYAITILLVFSTTNYAQQQKTFGYKISGSDDIISDVYLIHKDMILDSVCKFTDPAGESVKTYSFEYYDDGKLKSDYNFISFYFVDNTLPHPKVIMISGYRTYFYNEKGDADSISTGYWYNDQWHDSSSYRIDYVYNTYGKILSKTFFSKGVITAVEHNSYDSLNNLILNRVIDLVLKDTTDNIRKYDEQNRLKLKKSVKRINPDNFLQYEYQYDSTGNINCTLTNINEGDPHPYLEYYFEFDEFGRTVNEVFFSSYNPVDSTWGSSLDIPFDYNESDQILKMGETYGCWYNSDGNLDTLINAHLVYSGYLGGRATLVDSYGNIIRLPDYSGFTTFYYSELTTSLQERKENEINFTLYQNYPNPFNPTTTIEYELPVKGNVKLEIFNLLGEKVYSALNEVKSAGKHKIDLNLGGLASGIYFYKLSTSNFSRSKKMLLLK